MTRHHKNVPARNLAGLFTHGVSGGMARSVLALLLPVVMLPVYCAWSASLDRGSEAASVKVAADQNAVAGLGGMPPIPSGQVSTLSLRHATLHGLLMRAYGIRYSSILGPSWMDSTYYDVTAKVPSGARGQQVMEMLQKLLVERFVMRVRWETRVVKGWALVAGPLPLKLKKTELAPDTADLDPEGVPNRHAALMRNNGMRTLDMKGYSIQGLANAVWGELGEPVQDLTGVQGVFDITLQGETDNPSNILAGMSAASVKKSLHRYGIDLVRQKVQVKTLWVDSANKLPKAN